MYVFSRRKYEKWRSTFVEGKANRMCFLDKERYKGPRFFFLYKGIKKVILS